MAERLEGARREISVLPAISARYDRYQCVELDLESQVPMLLTHLLHGTRRRHNGLPPPRGTGTHVRAAPEFQVLKIEKIFNPRLQTDYQVLLDNIRGKHGSVPVAAVAPVPEDGTSQHYRECQIVNCSRWNERFLFHGAPADKIEAICTGGLDHRRAGSHMGALFGMGTYLAEDSSKADIYAKPDGGTKQDSVSCMLVCRACLGNTSYARKPLGGNCMMPPDDGDSVTALRVDEGGCLAHREYIVYDCAQAVLEYRIFYHHVAGCMCSICVL